MSVSRSHLLVLFATFALVMAAPRSANAQGLVTGTIANFDQAVEIPGHVLPAGTYAFVDKGNSVVQIWDKDQTKLYATLITNAAEQSQFMDERQEFEFEKSTSDSPRELKAWFQGSGRLGHEFIYEK
jgi:hypothetical protein